MAMRREGHNDNNIVATNQGVTSCAESSGKKTGAFAAWAVWAFEFKVLNKQSLVQTMKSAHQ
jgi:hypothetical protein